MSYSLTMSLSIILFFIASVIRAQDIIFETNDDSCKLPNGVNGICKDHRQCPGIFKNFPRERPVRCGFVGNHPIVCCPVKRDRVTGLPDILVPLIDISPPAFDFRCGDPTPSQVTLFVGSSENAGFADTPVAIRNRNARLTSDIDPNIDFQIFHIVGGVEARRVLAKYTALIGSIESSGLNDWFCTGVLLNHQWVLTAAHCRQRAITVVRLGEHDYEDPTDGATPLDVGVVENIPHPEYSSPQGYNDLALLRLSSFVTFGPSINPVCLPWGDASNTDLINRQITLTGWGATEFRGPLSSILQEVDVTVFSNSVCERSYSTLGDYQNVFPGGISENLLCAGDSEGGKDACQGDSGGPVTYLNAANQYVLAGAVSTGAGCGNKDFPGLYANIHYPPYLAWIKNVAFL